ncbi:hypothetical protein FRX31_014364 [Thalictrum thalictroides]|uniref:Uncharacterized protein n=1 Tax=Thalictrum thalictroides TaxID=46969 RepID=A0A7J6WF48_THATH|nr:hypothetical protein FRX31_014364 [Thalictrum thalictroides]
MDGEEDDVDLKIGSSEGYQGQDLELCLGQDKIESEQQYKDDDIMDYQESGGPTHWLLGEKNHMNNHFLRPCSPSLRHVEHSSGDFMYTGVDAHLNSADANIFANDYKRDICNDDIANHHSLHARH